MATPKQIDFFRELIEQGRQGGAMTAKVAGDPVGASVGDMWEAIQELINAPASAEQRKGQDEAYTPFNPADTKKTMPWLKSRADELDKSRKEKWAKQSEIYNAETGKLIATQEYQALDKQGRREAEGKLRESVYNRFRDEGEAFYTEAENSLNKRAYEALELSKRDEKLSIWDKKEFSFNPVKYLDGNEKAIEFLTRKVGAQRRSKGRFPWTTSKPVGLATTTGRLGTLGATLTE